MKFGIHVIWEPTAPNPTFEANRTSGMGDMAPPNFENFGQNGHGCQPLNPHISGMSDPIFIKLVLMDNLTRIPNMSFLFRLDNVWEH